MKKTIGLVLSGFLLGIVIVSITLIFMSRFTLGSFYYCGYGIGLNEASKQLGSKPTFDATGVCEKIKIFVEAIP